MRTKEVEEAIKTIQEQKENVECGINDMECMSECDDENIYNDYIELKKKAETLLSYIEKLEQLPNKIRDKIKELEELRDKYIEENKFGSYMNTEPRIQVLKELLEGK